MVALGLVFVVLLGKMELPGAYRASWRRWCWVPRCTWRSAMADSYRSFQAPELALSLSLPQFSLDFLQTLPQALHYLPIAIPFGIMTIVGGINNTESARLAGDAVPYARHPLDRGAHLAPRVLFRRGGADHALYRPPGLQKMGATYWYTLATGLAIGLGSVVGLLSIFVQLVPRAVLAPIFLFIGFEIVRQAYEKAPAAHSPAVSLAFLPTVANLVVIVFGPVLGCGPGGGRPSAAAAADAARVPDTLEQRVYSDRHAMGKHSGLSDRSATAHGRAVCVDLRGASLFGLIHSVLPSGEIYLLGTVASHTPYWIALGYTLLAAIFMVARAERAAGR